MIMEISVIYASILVKIVRINKIIVFHVKIICTDILTVPVLVKMAIMMMDLYAKVKIKIKNSDLLII